MQENLRLIWGISIAAGKATTNEELEEMLEQGSSAVFTQGVSWFLRKLGQCLLVVSKEENKRGIVESFQSFSKIESFR
jgi:hypothetical protein